MATDTAMRDDVMPPYEVEAFITGNILHAEIIAHKVWLNSTLKRVWHGGGEFWMKSQVGITYQEAYSELTFLRQSIEGDLEDRTFFFVLPENADLLQRKDANWSKIWEAIPDSKADITEAICSIALERNTAAVFHLMRVAEWGLRAICHDLGRANTEVIRKNGTIKLTPIEFSTWDEILKALPDDVEKKLNQVPNGPERQEMQEFYNQSILEIDAFKDAWRNHVMHTRKSFLPEDARSIMAHVKRFMDGLVANGVTTI